MKKKNQIENKSLSFLFVNSFSYESAIHINGSIILAG